MVLAVASSFIFVIGQEEGFGQAYEVDAHTLLLEGFEEDPYQADYSMGWGDFAGSGAPVVEGYYGKALDVRGVQLQENFLTQSSGHMPHMTQWGFWPRGNVHYPAGTLEFWFKVSDGTVQPSFTKSDALGFYSYQPKSPVVEDVPSIGTNMMKELEEAQKQGKIRRDMPYFRIMRGSISWTLIGMDGRVLRDSIHLQKLPGWEKLLDPENWHHLALVWSDQALVVYLDGRPLGHHDLKDGHGLALTTFTQRPMTMSGIIVDELRISSIPRYSGEFEPNWKENTRPDYAFTGVAGVAPHPEVGEQVDVFGPKVDLKLSGNNRAFSWGDWKLEFDEATGALASLKTDRGTSSEGANGILLRQGYERQPVTNIKAEAFVENAEGLEFVQKSDQGLEIENKLRVDDAGNLIWHTTFTNAGEEKQLLEVRCSLPLSGKSDEYFDSSWVQTDLRYPRRRDEYVFSLPFAAVSQGQQAVGVGINPGMGLSALLAEWEPTESGEMLRQGTRMVLNPGEVQELEFILVKATGNFGVKEAINTFHAAFPQFYRLNPDIPVYSYMGTAQHFPYVSIPDLARQFYIGGQWGHGPYHTKGDYIGTVKYWKNDKLDGRIDYRHAQGHQRIYKTIAQLRKDIVKRSRDSFNQYYTLRRSHDVPNLTAKFIVEDLWPDYNFPDDPLVAGQYYLPNMLIVNEFGTPLGAKFKNDQAETIRMIGMYSPGFINDMSQISPFRFVDEYARSSAGRAFAPERGEYLVGAFGHMDRYSMINSFSDKGNQQSMWSDFGQVSYMLSAHSSMNVLEGGEQNLFFTGMGEGLQASRNLLGEKPIAVLVSYGADYLGLHFKPEDFTPVTLRDYYRYSFEQTFLFALNIGIYLDPPYLHGRQSNVENNPILVETLVNGRAFIDAAKVKDPLFIRRGGTDEGSILAIGNPSPIEQTTDVEIFHLYFNGKIPLYLPYFGGSLQQQIGENSKIAGVKLQPRGVEALRSIAQLNSGATGEVTSQWSGDGLQIEVEFQFDLKEATQLALFAPTDFYDLVKVGLNEKSLEPGSADQIALPAGKSTVKAVWKNRVLEFDSVAWDDVEFVKEGKTNFALLAHSRPGYSRGTAMYLNYFLNQYDEENGEIGDLTPARIYDSASEIPQDYAGWKVVFHQDWKEGEGRVRLNAKEKEVLVSGRTWGEVRRATTVMMRQMDRKYPRIGRPLPLRRDVSGAWEKIHKASGFELPYTNETPAWERWIKRNETKEFFQQFADPNFLLKPVLAKSYDAVYENENMNFENKYEIRVSPYLFEPTFAEDYVYGYDGAPIEESEGELMQ